MRGASAANGPAASEMMEVIENGGKKEQAFLFRALRVPRRHGQSLLLFNDASGSMMKKRLELVGFESQDNFLWRQFGETCQLVLMLPCDKRNSLVFLRVSVGGVVATACLDDHGLSSFQTPFRNEIVAGVFERFSKKIRLWFDSFKTSSDIAGSGFVKTTFANVEEMVERLRLPKFAAVQNLIPLRARRSALELAASPMFEPLYSRGFLLEHVLILRAATVRFVRRRNEVFDVIEVISTFDSLAFCLKPFFWTSRLETPPEKNLPKFPRGIGLLKDRESFGSEFHIFPDLACEASDQAVRRLVSKLMDCFAEVNCVADLAKQIELNARDAEARSDKWQLVQRLLRN